MKAWALLLAVGCAREVPVDADPPPPPGITAPFSSPTRRSDVIDGYIRTALQVIWHDAFEEAVAPERVVVQDDCLCPFGADGCAYGESICVRSVPDGLRKDIFVHELIHAFVYRHGIVDDPVHSSALFNLEVPLALRLETTGIPGPDRFAQRTNPCGRGGQQCCFNPPQCESGLLCVPYGTTNFCTGE